MTETLRPLKTGELLDRTFFYYRRHFVMFVGIAALPNLVALALQLSRVAVQTRGGLLFSMLISVVAIVIVLVASTFSHGATVIAVSNIQLGRDASIREAFTSIRSQLGELIIISLNVGVRVVIGLLLLIVPGILQALKYALTVPVAILEKNGVSASLSRSADLTRGDRGRIFVIYFLLAILVVLGQAAAQAVMLVAIGTLGGRSPQQMVWVTQVFAPVGSFVTQSIFSPIMTIALTLVYYDERVKKEAFDLEHMMEQIDRGGLVSSPLA